MGTICRYAKLNQWLYSPTTELFISWVLYSCGGECCVGRRFPIRIMSEASRELEFVPAIGDRRLWFCGSQSEDPQDNYCN